MKTKLPHHNRHGSVLAGAVPFLMGLLCMAVVAAMSYDFGAHNARYAVHMACATEGEANLRISTIICAIATNKEPKQ